MFFPTFILEVDTPTDFHLVHTPVGRLAGLPDLDYVQSKFSPKPSASSTPATGATSADPVLPAIITPDDDKSLDGNDKGGEMAYAPHWPKWPLTPPPPAFSPDSITPVNSTRRLNDMTTAELAKLLLQEAVPTASVPLGTQSKRKQLDPIKCMETTKIIKLLHAHDKSPPPV